MQTFFARRSFWLISRLINLPSDVWQLRRDEIFQASWNHGWFFGMKRSKGIFSGNSQVTARRSFASIIQFNYISFIKLFYAVFFLPPSVKDFSSLGRGIFPASRSPTLIEHVLEKLMFVDGTLSSSDNRNLIIDREIILIGKLGLGGKINLMVWISIRQLVRCWV